MPGLIVALSAPALALLGTVLALCLPASSAAVKPAAPPGFFGVDTRSTDSADFAEMAAADVGVARTIFPLSAFKHAQDRSYDWGYGDNLLANTARNDIDLIPILYGVPPWISTDLNATPLRGQARGEWRRLLKVLVGRYGPNGDFWAQSPDLPYHPIETWQIWNEPNSITWWGPRPKPREYATLLKRSARTIHSVDPSAAVLTAGIVAEPTNNHAMLGTRFLARLFAVRGVKSASAAVAYHPYSRTVAAVKGQLHAARHVLRRRGAGSMPIWITEIGWGSKGPRDHPLIKTVKGQNRALRDSFEMVLRNRRRLGLARMLWYQWHDGRDDLCLWCESSGLLDPSSRPKGLLRTFARIATR